MSIAVQKIDNIPENVSKIYKNLEKSENVSNRASETWLNDWDSGLRRVPEMQNFDKSSTKSNKYARKVHNIGNNLKTGENGVS